MVVSVASTGVNIDYDKYCERINFSTPCACGNDVIIIPGYGIVETTSFGREYRKSHHSVKQNIFEMYIKWLKNYL